MKEHDPDKTLPRPGPTETQRFTAVPKPTETLPPVPRDDHEKTNPHLKVGTFPEHPVAKAEVPPTMMSKERLREINRIIRVMGKPYEYGGIKLHDVEFLSNGDLAGTDENGVRFIVPREEVHMFLGDDTE